MYRHFFKRIIDTIVSVVLFVLALPVFLLLVIVFSISFHGTPFFAQRRPGMHGKSFTILKFKTMRDLRDESGILLADERRLTSLGRFVRGTSLDELPQLLNVILGDMSIIGPRPLLEEYLPLYTAAQRRRHDVRPGITGWAQVNGRNAVGWTKKFEYDLWYVDHCSFGLDIRILLLTIRKVWRREGITSAASATTEKFSGSI
jgi:undecaprenyl phosphate N,N'-diacetylbacillosamine 1-phosphate transferase